MHILSLRFPVVLLLFISALSAGLNAESQAQQFQLQTVLPPRSAEATPQAGRALSQSPSAKATLIRSVSAAADELTPAPLSVPQVPLPNEAVGAVIQPCPGFWILSTACSRQSADDGCLQLRPHVQKFTECGGFAPSGFGELTTSLQPGIPIVVMVHGSFVDAATVCRESLCTYEWLKAASGGRPFQFIFFNWPSEADITPLVQLDIAVLGRRAARNGYYLCDLVQHLPPESTLSLIGHSHGCRVIASGLHMLAGGSVQGIRHPAARVHGRRIRTVFSAAAIDHDWLNPGERYGRALCSTECLLNLKNHHDPALKIYPLRRVFSSRALGSSGFTSSDRRDLGGWSRRVADCDVSRVIGHHHNWPHYCSKFQLARTVSNYVFF